MADRSLMYLSAVPLRFVTAENIVELFRKQRPQIELHSVS